MPSATDSATVAPPAPMEFSSTPTEIPRLRKNGQHWKPPREAFRPASKANATTKSWDARQVQRKAMVVTKAKENELKQEKEDERKRKVQAIKDKKVAKAEKERYEMLAQKMHAKRVDRLRRREKRNKALKER